MFQEQLNQDVIEDNEIFEIIPKKKSKKVKIELIEIPDTTDNIRDELEKKLNSASIDTLVEIFRTEFKSRITNMKCSSIPLEKRKNIIITKILEAASKTNNDIDKKIIDTYFFPQIKNTEWVNDFVVGEEVLFHRGTTHGWHSVYVKAKVMKINKSSISIRLFHYKVVIDENAYENQTYGYNKMVWDNFTDERKIVYQRGALKKYGEIEIYNKYFTQGEYFADYGC